MRFDPDAGVKRVANGMWKTAGGAPKVQKAIVPAIKQLLMRFESGDLGAGIQKLAKVVYEEIGEQGADEVAIAKAFVFPTPVPDSARAKEPEFARIASGKPADGAEMDAVISGEKAAGNARVRSNTMAQNYLEENADFKKLPAAICKHCGMVARSVVAECRRKKMPGKKIVGVLAEALESSLALAKDDAHPLISKLPEYAEAAVRATLGDAFDAVTKGGANDEEMLLYVENLLLMYGGGHLLLKDTVLEMKKNARYGVVGHNGAGKTTLMKEIAGHRIVNMPKDLKCVHVDDSKLGDMTKSSLTALEYCIKMAKDIDAPGAGKETLVNVGFEEARLAEPVSELSTGWRMRLTLAVSMLKHADLVLLDEPTNHLDEQSVDWLAEYILSITKSSVMVISHEPKFLNRICTHVIAYVDKKLEYTEGDFNAFAAKKGLSKDQIDAMLSGNLSFDTEEAEEGEEGGEKKESVVKAGGPPAGPPKLSFPIPGG